MSNPVVSKINIPTTIIVVGATGDLATRKLFPALMDLFSRNLLPDDITIVGFSRREWNDEDFRNFVKSALEKKNKKYSKDIFQFFLNKFTYSRGTFDERSAYERLSSKLDEIDLAIGTCSNKLFYLAVPPKFYEEIIEKLAIKGLSTSCQNQNWTRILVEKPFGQNLQSSQDLDRKLGKLFKEEQIYRIDHYLQKEVLSNILMFRFSNVLFEPIWNKHYVEKIEIKMHEEIGVKSRGSFYEATGALLDVGQNHMLQMLAAVTMDRPLSLKAEDVRETRAKLIGQIDPNVDDVKKGQYIGYLEEEGVSGNSSTETYFKFTTYLNNKVWKGVPIIMEAGKKLPEAKAEIKIYFKESDNCLCDGSDSSNYKNILTFRIQPNQGIAIKFWAKKPEFSSDLIPLTLGFGYEDDPDVPNIPDAYEELLFDAISGYQNRFLSTEEAQAAWRFVTDVMKNWKDVKTTSYHSGTNPGEN